MAVSWRPLWLRPRLRPSTSSSVWATSVWTARTPSPEPWCSTGQSASRTASSPENNRYRCRTHLCVDLLKSLWRPQTLRPPKAFLRCNHCLEMKCLTIAITYSAIFDSEGEWRLCRPLIWWSRGSITDSGKAYFEELMDTIVEQDVPLTFNFNVAITNLTRWTGPMPKPLSAIASP